MLETSAERRVLILGDSWVRGLLFERRRPFGKLVAQSLGAAEVLDLSATSRTAVEVVEHHLEAIAGFKPSIAIMNVGGADSLVFPPPVVQRSIERWAPENGHGAKGWLPPASYSSNQWKRLHQRSTHVVRIASKQILVHALGGRRRVPLPDFEAAAGRILDELTSRGALVVVIGFALVDSLFSPKTNSSVRATNGVLKKLAAQHESALYIGTSHLVRRWEDYLADHVHLSAEGHQRVAAGVLDALKREGEPWCNLPAVAAGFP